MKYESDALKVIHEGAIDKFKAGIISESRMREYDEMCLKKHKVVKKSLPVYIDNTTAKHIEINHTTA